MIGGIMGDSRLYTLRGTIIIAIPRPAGVDDKGYFKNSPKELGEICQWQEQANPFEKYIHCILF